jgi:hypothetical protein
VNLQVEDFVVVSGGTMVTTLEEAVTALDALRAAGLTSTTS